MGEIDYLLIGHVCKDLTPEGPRLGGTVSFSALTARALGQRVGILTSAPDDMIPLLHPLDGLPLIRVPASRPTTFKNIYTPDGRVQMLLGRATPLRFSHVPPEWRSAGIVHLAPVADEVDPALAGQFPASMVGVTPQGWMRRWDVEGRVSFRPWRDAEQVLRLAMAVVLSIEDVGGDEGLLRWYARQARVMVVTRGAEGCTLYLRGDPHTVSAPRVVERDPTGAGDIFAAAFFVRLRATGDPLVAARFATRLASYSVTREGPDSIPGDAEIKEALSESRGQR